MDLKKILTYSLIVMSLVIIGASFLLNKSLSPLKQAKAETVKIAETKADLTEPEDFYWYNGNNTYFTVTGKNSESEEIIVIVKQDGGSTEIFNKKDVFPKSKAIAQVRELDKPAHILEARIGIHNDLAIWEISFRQENGKIGYTMLSLTSGEWVRTIKNI